MGGIDIILGNSLDGGIVCKGISLPPPSPIVVNTPWFDDPCHQKKSSFPDVFTACAIMRAMTRGRSDIVSPGLEGKDKLKDYVSLYVWASTVWREEFIKEQQADPFLTEMLGNVLSKVELRNVSMGNILCDGLLVIKWVPDDHHFVEDPVS